MAEPRNSIGLYGTVAIVWLLSLQLITASCPSGWTQSDGSCLAAITPTLAQGFTSVWAAREACQTYGADLVSVNDEKTFNKSVEAIASLTSPPTWAIIGGTDIQNGMFSWLDNTTFSYEKWKLGEPLRHGMYHGDDCVLMENTRTTWDANDTMNVTWVTAPCCLLTKGREHSVAICQKPEGDTVNLTERIIKNKCLGACPIGWYRHRDHCYKAFDVRSKTVSSLYRARQECRAEGADLLDIRNQSEAQHVAYVMTIENMNATWLPLGMSDDNGGDSLQHLDKTTVDANLNFWNGVTNANSDQKCVRIESVPASDWMGTDGDGRSFQWREMFCCNETADVIMCQKPMNNSTGSSFPSPENDVMARHCFEHVDDCSPNPCQNGTCVDMILDYNCTCDYGYEGRNCTNMTDFCVSDPCVNNGTCELVPGGYKCNCIYGYTGQHCETLFDECISNPCQNNGNCTDLDNGYTCTCPVGYTGTHCETDINYCENITCQNGASCIDRLTDFECNCSMGFGGQFCEKNVTCTPIGQVANATVNSTGSAEGDIAVISCFPHHKFPDMVKVKVLSCTSSKSWNESVPSGCDLHCDAMPQVANSVPSTNSTLHGSVVNFTCLHGFSFPDNSTWFNITCLNDGTWDQDLSTLATSKQCEIITCPELPHYPYTETDHRNNTFNSTVIFSCDIGFTFHDGTTARTITCRETGRWTAKPPECKPVECPAVTQIAMGSSNSTNNTYSAYVEYRCDPGKRMIDGATFRIVKCDATGEWSDNVTDCAADRCYPLPYASNNTPSSLEATFNNVVTLTCIIGHEYQDNTTSKDTTCQTDHTWRPLPESCVPIRCLNPSVEINSTKSTEMDIYSTVIDYTCDKGHYYSDNSSVKSTECLYNKQWNATVGACHPIECPAPPEVYNGSKIDPANFLYDSLTNYTCDPGTKFWDGKRTRNLRCNEFGSWNETDVSCRRDRCDPVPIADHVIPDNTNTSWFTNVTYSCESGYEWKPPNNYPHKTSCTNTGEWNNNNVPPCTIKQCPTVPPLNNSDPSTTDHVFDTVVNYTCHTGYEYYDNETVKSIRCNANAQWEPIDPPQCQIKHCPPVTPVANATTNNTNTEFNTTVIFECLPGYHYAVDRTLVKSITCTDNETWTEYPPDCETVHCPPLLLWGGEFNTTDTDFAAVALYSCDEGFGFKDGEKEKLTMCQEDKTWYPPIEPCEDLESIAADLKDKAYDAPEAVSIGTVALAILCVVFAAIILLDLNKIFSDIYMMYTNLKSMYDYKKGLKGETDA